MLINVEHFCELECLNTAMGSLIKKAQRDFSVKSSYSTGILNSSGILSSVEFVLEFQLQNSRETIQVYLEFHWIFQWISVNWIGQCLDSVVDRFILGVTTNCFEQLLIFTLYVGLPLICFISVEKLVCDNYYGTERNASLLNPIK